MPILYSPLNKVKKISFESANFIFSVKGLCNKCDKFASTLLDPKMKQTRNTKNHKTSNYFFELHKFAS